MGSEFSYADMRRIDASLSTHKRLADERSAKDATFVVESTPKKEAKAPYAKLQVWVRKSDFIPLRTRFYDAGGELLKTLYARKVGQASRPTRGAGVAHGEQQDRALHAARRRVDGAARQPARLGVHAYGSRTSLIECRARLPRLRPHPCAHPPLWPFGFASVHHLMIRV